MYLLISHCNTHNKAALSVIDTSKNSCDQILLPWTLQDVGSTGITGILVTEWGYAICSQSHERQVLLMDYNFRITADLSDSQIIDPHGIAGQNGDLMVVSTGTGSLVRLRGEGSSIGAQKVATIGALCGRLHLNDVVFYNNQPLVTGFGENTHSGPRNGFLANFYSGARFSFGLREPHSITAHGDSIYLLESITGALIKVCFNGEGGVTLSTIFKFTGYVRGLAVNDNIIAVGRSANRNISRSLGGTVDRPIASCNDEYLYGQISGVYLMRRGDNKFIFIDTTCFGSEIYSICIVDDRFKLHCEGIGRHLNLQRD